MNADVEKAVAVLDVYHGDAGAWNTVKQALREQETEIARLQNIADGNAELYQHELLRSEKADALLQECLQCTAVSMHPATLDRITTHLGANDAKR